MFGSQSTIAAAILASSILSHAATQAWDGDAASWNTANDITTSSLSTDTLSQGDGTINLYGGDLTTGRIHVGGGLNNLISSGATRAKTTQYNKQQTHE